MINLASSKKCEGKLVSHCVTNPTRGKKVQIKKCKMKKKATKTREKMNHRN